MKHKNFIFSLILVLTVSLLFACSPQKIEQKLDAAEDSVEQKLDKAEDKIEGALTPNSTPATDAKITAEKAQEIALAHAGFTADQVTGLYAEYEIDDGIPHYDVQFRRERMEYEYEIHAETGEIISFDMDD